jgi:hypothetical protein
MFPFYTEDELWILIDNNVNSLVEKEGIAGYLIVELCFLDKRSIYLLASDENDAIEKINQLIIAAKGDRNEPGFSESLYRKTLRMSIDENFIFWADKYFSSETNINVRISRRALFNDFLTCIPYLRGYYTPSQFVRCLIMYCEWKRWKINPHLYDSLTGIPKAYNEYGSPVLTDHEHGVEYFTIGDKNFK